MSKTGIALAGLAAALGLAFGYVSGAWGFEQGVTYILLSDALLLATILTALARRPVTGTAVVAPRSRIVVEVIMVVVSLMFCGALFAASVGGKASDANEARYLMVAAAFVPLAVVRRSAHQFWNAVAPLVLLTFAPVMTSIALAVAGDVNVWANPITFSVATLLLMMLAGRLPSVSDRQVGRIEAGLAITAAFLTGVTAVGGSYGYDGRAAALIGIIMVIVGWLVGVMLRRWEYAPSRTLNWQNLVIGVWIGQFMPGASVMVAVALIVGWALYGTMQGISGAFRKARLRRQTASN